MIGPSFLLLGLVIGQTPGSDTPGKRVDLDGATLFVPVGYRPKDGVVDVVFHLHGAPSVVEPALVETKWNAVLIEFNRKGLSRAYAEPLHDESVFPRLLDAALVAVERLGIANRPTMGRVVVSTFSAGFGGVRELLKRPQHFARIDTLVMADSLYSGYEGAPAARRVDPALMDGFRRFAAEAAEGRKTFVLTHSAQVPEGYASTTETADFLMRTVGGEPSTVRAAWGDGWTQTRRCMKGRFLVLGFEGAGADDHMLHLRRIARVWAAVPAPAGPRP